MQSDLKVYLNEQGLSNAPLKRQDFQYISLSKGLQQQAEPDKKVGKRLRLASED